jgi:hypothetical protein
MEKLLNLLQEFYWENRKFSNENWLLTMANWVENLSGAYAQTYIISKQGWFIKWLVENDKIDFENRDLKDIYMEHFERYPYRPYTDFSLEWLIMLLSIQDNPIEFLVSILK